MHLLVIGGTQFVGRAMVEEALERGHTVTLFHRGKTNAGLFQNDARIEHILGDRNTDLGLLDGRTWDAVIDCVGYFPHETASMAAALKVKVGTYAFVSTISVYQGSTEPTTEDSVVLPVPEGHDMGVVTKDTYGPLKVLAENEIDQVFGSNVLHIRAGLQIGEHDHTDRFSNWVERIALGTKVLVPTGEPMPWQLIDARDTARFALHCLETGTHGRFNVTGESQPMTAYLALIREVVSPETEFLNVSAEQISQAGLEPWRDIALWLPADMRGGFPLEVRVDKALEAGLTFRPAANSIQEIWEAIQDWPADRPRRAGISPEREREAMSALGLG